MVYLHHGCFLCLGVVHGKVQRNRGHTLSDIADRIIRPWASDAGASAVCAAVHAVKDVRHLTVRQGHAGCVTKCVLGYCTVLVLARDTVKLGKKGSPRGACCNDVRRA